MWRAACMQKHRLLIARWWHHWYCVHVQNQIEIKIDIFVGEVLTEGECINWPDH